MVTEAKSLTKNPGMGTLILMQAFCKAGMEQLQFLGRPLGYFILSLTGLKRTLFTNIFQRL